MPKINVYLPDALAERVKAADLPVSRICQAALSAAVGDVEGGDMEGDPRLLPEDLRLDRPPNDQVVTIVATAYEEAAARGSTVVEAVDLLRGVAAAPDSLVLRMLQRSGVTPARLDTLLGDGVVGPEVGADTPRLGAEARAVLARASVEAARTDARMVHGLTLGVGLVGDPGAVGDALRTLGADRVFDPAVLDVIADSFAFSRSLAGSVPDPWAASALADLVTRLDRIERRLV